LLREAEGPREPSTLSDRSLADSQAEMGYGTTRPLERVMASCGLLTSAELEFVAADDVPNGGVLCALPALLAEGLLRHTRTFYRLPAGFYPLESIFLAFGSFGAGALPFAGAGPLPVPRGVVHSERLYRAPRNHTNERDRMGAQVNRCYRYALLARRSPLFAKCTSGSGRREITGCARENPGRWKN
jgi:hypothetical protein